MPAGEARVARFPSVALRVTTSPKKRYASSQRTNGLRRKVFLGDLFKPGGLRRRYRVCRGNPFPHAETSYGSSFGQVDHRRPQSFFLLGLFVRETIRQPVQVHRRGSGRTLPIGFGNPRRARALESRCPRCQQPMAPEHPGFRGCAGRPQGRLRLPICHSRGFLSLVPTSLFHYVARRLGSLDQPAPTRLGSIISGSLDFLYRVD